MIWKQCETVGESERKTSQFQTREDCVANSEEKKLFSIVFQCFPMFFNVSWHSIFHSHQTMFHLQTKTLRNIESFYAKSQGCCKKAFSYNVWIKKTKRNKKSSQFLQAKAKLFNMLSSRLFIRRYGRTFIALSRAFIKVELIGIKLQLFGAWKDLQRNVIRFGEIHKLDNIE